MKLELLETVAKEHMIRLNEYHVTSYGTFYHAKKILYHNQSKYCILTVFDTEDLGRVFLIDGDNMFATKTEHVYHETMAHVPLFLHKDPKEVLIIGGGDAGVLKEVVKHKGIKKITLVDIDEDVVKVCREFFPEMTKAMDDPRVNVVIDDGVEYVRRMVESKQQVDVCIIDSNDLYLKVSDPSNVLGSPQFYENVKKIVRDDGLVMQILGCHVFWAKALETVYENIFEVWDYVYPHITAVPLYASGFWSLVLLAKQPIDVRSPRKCDIEGLKHYNEDIHAAGFALPNDLRAIVSRAAKKAGKSF